MSIQPNLVVVEVGHCVVDASTKRCLHYIIIATSRLQLNQEPTDSSNTLQMYTFTTALTPMPPRRLPPQSDRSQSSGSSSTSSRSVSSSDKGSPATFLTTDQAYIHPRHLETGYYLEAFEINNTIRNLSIANQDLDTTPEAQPMVGRRLQRLANLELTFSQLMHINLFSNDWTPEGPGSVPRLFISGAGRWCWHAAMDLVTVTPMRNVSHLFVECVPAPAEMFQMMESGMFPDLEYFGIVVRTADKTDDETPNDRDEWIRTIRSQLESVIKGAPKLKRVYVHVVPAVWNQKDILPVAIAELRLRLAVVRGPTIAVGHEVEGVNADLKERVTYWYEQGTFWEAASTRDVDVWAAGVPIKK